MPFRIILLLTFALCPLTRGWGAAPHAVWQAEAANFPPAQLRFGAAVVDDPLALTRKTLRIPWQKDAKGWSVQIGTPPVTLQGKCRCTFLFRGEGMLPMSGGMTVRLIVHDKATGETVTGGTWTAYGLNLKPDAYTPITFALDLTETATAYRNVEMLFEWQEQSEGSQPVLFMDKAEVSSDVLDAPHLVEVTPTKVRNAPGEPASVQVTIANPTSENAELTLVGEDCFGLTGRRAAFKEPVALKPGETKTVSATWTLGTEEYGHDIAVALLSGSTVLDRASELFGVSKTPRWLSVENTYDAAQPPVDKHTIFYVQPATAQESWNSIRFFKRLSPGGEQREFFSWAPGDISDLAPVDEVFPGGEGRLTYRSKSLVQKQIAMLTSVGQWPVSYVNGTVWAASGYKLFNEHPDWFLYDSTGEVCHYEMDHLEIYRHKDDLGFDPTTYPGIFFQATLNHSLPQVQEYIAHQLIRCGKEMGFRGIRMDVRYLEVYPGERDFSGREVAPTYAEADRISTASVKHVKELVHAQLPDFTFGYNYASPDETKNMRLTMQERCAGAGWMLDEASCGYQGKGSPYHIWADYARRMASWGDQVTRWGGIYNPFDFRRGGGKYPVDRAYSSIFRLIGAGRISCYYNSRLPVGNLGRFATRYSELFYGKGRTWIPEVKNEVTVHATAPLWWKDLVFWNRDTAGNRQLIVNLVNPPAKEEVEENPRSELLPPVRNVEVNCGRADGKLPKAAYLLMAEPMETTGEPAMRMIELPIKRSARGLATVTVPSVIFWKIVVFEY